MYRRAIAICASGVALAAVAQAAPRTYESWSVSAALKQPTGVLNSATITPGTGLQAFTDASTTYTITANPGYDIRSIIVDGRTISLAPAEKDLKTVTFDNTRLLHTLVANTVAEKYTVSTSVSPARKGAFSPASLKNISYGTAKTVKVVPMKGWDIAAVTLNGTPLANPINPDGTMTVSFQNNVGAQALAATFSQKHAVNAVISPVGDRSFDVNKGPVSFELDAFRSTSNVKPVTYLWELSGVAQAGDATITSTNTGKTVFTATQPGVYTVKLTVSDGTVSSTKQVLFTAKSATLSSSASCMTCHKDAVDDTNANIVGKYTTSPHATRLPGATCAQCHGSHSAGKTNAAAACATCHTNTDAAIVAKYDASQHKANSVSCAACHDGHSTAAGLTNCATCHQTSTPALFTEWQGGRHGSATGHNTGTCQRCHATEGAIAGATYGWTGGYNAVLKPYTSTVWRNNKPAVSSNGISCAVCHNQHSGGMRAVNTIVGGSVVPWDPNQNGAVDQYDVCTSCHTLTDNSGAVVGNYHDASSASIERTITDSHYDNSGTGAGLATTTIEGYVIRGNTANACADCHNLHTADLTVQEQWADSAHAGKIKKQKEDALLAGCIAYYAVPNGVDPKTTIRPGSTRTYWEDYIRTTTSAANGTLSANATAKAAGVTGTSGPAWEHYDWDNSTGTASDRKSCQRCHTATGLSNFLTNPATYNAANNDFSHLSGWTAAKTSPQNELLYCWGCHSDSQTGALRNPGALTFAASNGASISLPDVGKSNVCVACHSGQESGQSIKGSTANFASLGAIQPHYLAAGGTLLARTGYEFAGSTYPANGTHAKIGVADFYNTGTAGPCVSCHMSGAEKHTFEVSATNAVCANCHTGLTKELVEESKTKYDSALAALNDALKAKGVWFIPSYPYFVSDNGYGGSVAGDGILQAGEMDRNNAFKNWDGVVVGGTTGHGKDVMGAAFNYNLLVHEPGAFAHNKAYAYKLILDSIDYLADGVVNGQGIPAAVTAAANSKEIAEATSHSAAISAAASATSCADCHAPAPHYGGAYNTGNAQFVANNGTCADCHANGDIAANKAILVQYAESAHGDPAGAAWKTSSSHDWPNAATCRDCHSTTGFTAKVGGTPRSTVVAGAGQTLACDACHTSVVTGEVRPAPQYVAGFKSQTLSGTTWTLANASFPVTVYKNASNPAMPIAGAEKNTVCVTCHSGRESGESIKALADAGMNNVSFKNPHYLGAAGMMYAKLAYNFAGQDDAVPGAAAGTTYGKTLTAQEDGGALSSTHRKLGTPAINGDSHNTGFFVAGNLDSAGPCVTCHMGGTTAGVAAGDHTWEVKQVALDQVCSKCHAAEAADLAGLEFFLEEQAVPFQDAIALAIAKLGAYNIDYSEAYPYFMEKGTATAVKDWTRGGTLTAAEAKNLMGACLNIKLMKAEPAAYVHARTYARRVLYDTIDWLDDKTLNLSTGATALAADPVKFAKDTTAGGTTTESAKYLMKYDRTTLAWDTASERP